MWLYVFLAFYIIGSLLRIVCSNVFGLNNFTNLYSSDESYPHIYDVKDTLITLPTYMFFVVYCILLSCLAEIYFITHNNERQERASLYRKLHSYEGMFGLGPEHGTGSYKVINIILIVVTVLMLTLFVVATSILFAIPGDQKKFKAVLQLVLVVLYFAMSLGFCIFGWLIFFQSRRIVKSLPVGNDDDVAAGFRSKESKSQSILLGNSIISIFFFFIFIIRLSFICVWSYFNSWGRHSDGLDKWSSYFLYYIVFEALPLALMLFIFTVIPGKVKPKDDREIHASY